MVRNAPRPQYSQPQGGYQVQVPRQWDAMGNVLRGAYGDGSDLPDDMLTLLRKIPDTPRR